MFTGGEMSADFCEKCICASSKVILQLLTQMFQLKLQIFPLGSNIIQSVITNCLGAHEIFEIESLKSEKLTET